MIGRPFWSMAAVCVWSLSTVSAANAASATPVAAEKGMVVSAQHLATQVGVDILKHGGSAIDAAVAVGFALAVVYPAAGNLGGGGFMTILFADGRKIFLDFREKAPRAASRDMFLDKDGNIIKGLSTIGWLAVGVPGTVSGLEYARKKYGTMTRTALIEPAIELADDGFILEQGDIDMLASATEDFRKFPATAEIFLNKGQPFVAGQRLVQRDLADTLRSIRKQGVDGFYGGKTGAAIIKASKAGGGIIDQEDLDRYKTRELPPVECDYRAYHVISAPPPSSGGVAICEMLNILEGYPLRELGWESAQALHYEIEAMRHAYADRSSLLGDPDFVGNPSQKLIDKSYAAKIRDAIKPDKAGISGNIRQGVAPHEGSNTTHFSIIDDAGTAVSMTYTLNDWFGARVVASGTGVLMNDEMDDFTPNPRRQWLRVCPGRSQCDRAGQGAPKFDEPDDHHEGRQACPHSRHAGRKSDHHRCAANHREPGRFPDEHSGSRRCPSHPSAVAAGCDKYGAVRAFARHPQSAGGHGAPVRLRSRRTIWPRSLSARRALAER